LMKAASVTAGEKYMSAIYKHNLTGLGSNYIDRNFLIFCRELVMVFVWLVLTCIKK
jgi:hypothetical protein